MIKSPFELEVLVNGKPVREYLHDGKVYIEGKENTNFSLRLKNNSHERVVFVPSVDGLSVMDGKEASFNSTGYIVDGYSALTIDGWRTSLEKVAQFFFTNPGNAYGSKRGKGQNLGVIGAAVFRKKVEPIAHSVICPAMHMAGIKCRCFQSWPQPSRYEFPNGTTYTATGHSYNSTMLSASNASVKMMRSVSQDIGTGFGEEKHSPVTTVEFAREKLPAATFEILYNTRQQLEQMGVEFHKPVYVAPTAFPAENGWCPRP